MRSRVNALIFSFMAMAIAMGIVYGCGSSGTGSESASRSLGSTGVTNVEEGRDLYASKCVVCHGNIDTTDIDTPTGFSVIRRAITIYPRDMGVFSTMSDADILAIAYAINNPRAPAPTTPTQTGTPPPTLDGAAIYGTRCAVCHGAIASSNKIGATLERIQGAIIANIGRMGPLSDLTTLELQAVVAVLDPSGSNPTPLGTTPIPPSNPPLGSPLVTDGAALYSANCAACHGALGSSSKAGTTLARLQNATNSNVGGMGYLSQLTVAQQEAIVSVLASASPPSNPPLGSPLVTDGAALYSANCAACHGALASTGKAGATAGRIQNAITGNIGNMGFLSTLSNAQVTAMEAALTTVAPLSPTDGPGLYAAYCASCHRSFAKSELRGKSAREISSAIRENEGGMGSLSILTSSMIKAIADALKESESFLW